MLAGHRVSYFDPSFFLLDHPLDLSALVKTCHSVLPLFEPLPGLHPFVFAKIFNEIYRLNMSLLFRGKANQITISCFDKLIEVIKVWVNNLGKNK